MVTSDFKNKYKFYSSQNSNADTTVVMSTLCIKHKVWLILSYSGHGDLTSLKGKYLSPVT